jgi:hypothetical protein
VTKGWRQQLGLEKGVRRRKSKGKVRQTEYN